MSESKIVSIHSYRGGTGKSNIAANVAASAVEMGKRVAIIDTDLQSPGIHVIFGFEQSQIKLTLVDFLWNRCSISETAYDITEKIIPDSQGKCYLIPASLTAQAITRILDEGYDVSNLNTHIDNLIEELDLDYLFIDTHPGLNRETMLTTAISDILILLIRPDQQDYYGTTVLSEIANKLEIPKVFLVINKVFSTINSDQLSDTLKNTFNYDVIGVIPLSEDFARLESRELFIKRNPNHQISYIFKDITKKILSV